MGSDRPIDITADPRENLAAPPEMNKATIRVLRDIAKDAP